MSLFFNSLIMQMSVISITETWLTETSPQSLDNDEFVDNNRCNRKVGSTGILIRSNILFKWRHDIDVNTSYIESTFIEIDTHGLSVRVIYRPPDQAVEQFNDSLSNIVNIVDKENKTLYIMGDFDIDVLKVGNVQSVNEFLEILMLYFMLPVLWNIRLV